MRGRKLKWYKRPTHNRVTVSSNLTRPTINNMTMLYLPNKALDKKYFLMYTTHILNFAVKDY